MTDAARFGRVAVLLGGTSAEREVSLKSGTMVLEALRRRGVDAHPFDTGRESLAALEGAGFDRAFIALHGRGGEDGTLQGWLELIGLPYTGSGVMASAVAMDKVFTKRIWSSLGLPTPHSTTVDAARVDDDLLRAVIARIGLPLIVKPPHEGSTIGITRVTRAEALREAIAIAGRHDPVVLVERFIDGPELTCAVLQRDGRTEALPVIRIVAPGGNYDYHHKYLSDDTRYLCPAGLPEALETRVRSLVVQAFDALGCEGWGRADLMLDAAGEPWLLEMNTSPGMTGHSLVPMAARAAGLSYEDLALAILDTARLKGGVARRPAGGPA